MGKGYGIFMGEPQHLPPPELPGTPLSFPLGTTLHQQPKILGDIQEPSNNMAYLLVCTGDALEDRNYGVSLVWTGPNQVWASSMEEAVETLSAYISSGPDWHYTLVQLYKGSSHTPLPKDKHLGILPQRKAEESSYGQISQLKVCQFLSTGPQVVYPVVLNGNDEPITTTLPELLSSGARITTSEHLYMRIYIPPPPPEESECMALPVDEAHTIPVANSPKTSLKPRVSVKVATVEAVTSPSQKSEASSLLINTSSEVSMEETEAFLRVSQPMSPLPLLPTAVEVPVPQ